MHYTELRPSLPASVLFYKSFQPISGPTLGTWPFWHPHFSTNTCIFVDTEAACTEETCTIQCNVQNASHTVLLPQKGRTDTPHIFLESYIIVIRPRDKYIHSSTMHGTNLGDLPVLPTKRLLTYSFCYIVHNKLIHTQQQQSHPMAHVSTIHHRSKTNIILWALLAIWSHLILENMEDQNWLVAWWEATRE